LTIVDVVQVKRSGGHFINYKSAPVNVSAKPVLAPNESYCYPYDILLTPIAGARYRNTARITISNYAGHEEGEYGPCDDDEGEDNLADKGDGIRVAFTIPTTSSAGPPIDADAVIHDGMPIDNQGSHTGPCAEHFYMYWCSTDTERSEWHLWNTGTIEYINDLHNFFGCDDDFDFPNTAELIEGGGSGTGTRRTARASVRIYSDACAPAPGCVRNDDYWKVAKTWPDERPEIGDNWIRDKVEFFDSGKTWQKTIANRSSDVYATLAREYVTSSLNRANDARMPADVRHAYADAAHWFAMPPGERALTGRSTLLGWAAVLERYNGGMSDIPSCPKGKKSHEHDDDREHRS
jgi:hypothetical protein